MHSPVVPHLTILLGHHSITKDGTRENNSTEGHIGKTTFMVLLFLCQQLHPYASGIFVLAC